MNIGPNLTGFPVLSIRRESQVAILVLTNSKEISMNKVLLQFQLIDYHGKYRPGYK